MLGLGTQRYTRGMCNRYVSPSDRAIEEYWRVRPSADWTTAGVYPRAPGPFIRSARSGGIECVIGPWGLIPFFATQPKLPYSTNNARFEELAEKASYKGPWAKGQRCIIAALSFDEPCWETGKNVWWRFLRADGAPWGLAGLYNSWVDRASGEVYESYTMLTVNADAHPIMRRMHKPDPNYGPDEQDKRSVVAIEHDDVEQWLTGTQEQASALVRPPAPEVLEAGPARG